MRVRLPPLPQRSMNTNKSAKRILIYGDSYTFGKIPGGSRYDCETRFTGILQKDLGDGFEVIEEGLRGRMMEGENKYFPYRNGFEQFGPILGSHLPVDLVVFMLGTNDSNNGDQQPEETVLVIKKYLEKIDWWSNHLGFTKPKILIVVPPMVDETSAGKVFGEIFKNSEEKLKNIRKLFIDYCLKTNTDYVDLFPTVKVSPVDGIHLDEINNKVVGILLSAKIKTLEL